MVSEVKPAQPGERSEPVIMAVALKCIQEVSAVRLKLPSDLKPLDQRVMVIKMIQVQMCSKSLSTQDLYESFIEYH